MKALIFLDLTFFAAALKASLWLISGFPALIRWISSLQIGLLCVKLDLAYAYTYIS